MRLNRNFIALTNASQYYETLKNKITYEKTINEKDVSKLFDILIECEKNDIELYNKIMHKLGEYTEGFVLSNAIYIYNLLKLSEEERKIIMVEFDNLNYSDDLNVLDFIKHIKEVFIIRINKYIKNNKNNEFRIQILDEVLQIFPSMNKTAIFSKLFMDLFLEINEIGYEIFKNEIKEIEMKKEFPFKDYQRKCIRKMITEKIKGN